MPEAAHPANLLRFGVFEVDIRAGELRKHGLKVRLQERPFQILALLLEHPGQVVTREQIRQRLWPADTFVDFDHSVNTAINKLREALGDSAENPHFVETLPRHGYRFIGHVEPVKAVRAPPAEGSLSAPAKPGTSPAQDQPPGDSAPAVARQASWPVRERRRRGRIAALVAGGVVAILPVLIVFNVAGLHDRLLPTTRISRGLPLPKIESIAVLPMENLSGDPTQEYFADGMTEELITDLGKISALRVISRTSVMRYKGTRKPLPEIGRELHADAIVEGTVLRSGDQVRITANLLYAPNDRHLWAQSYERKLGDVLLLQSEVARAIASQIRTTLTPQEDARLAASRPVNPEAHRLYLQGRYYFFKRTHAAFERSIQLFLQALEKDPNYALAYAGLSESYGTLPFFGGAVPREVFPKAKEAALRALAIDNNLAEAHAALGNVLFYYDWDWLAAERELKLAIELKPSYVVAHHWYAEYLSAMGRHEQAIAEIRRAQELDPVSPLMRAIGGEIYINARRYDQAIEQCRKALELDSDYGLAYRYLGWAYAGKGMNEEALAEFKQAGRLIGRDTLLDPVRVSAEMGRKSEAMKMLDQFKEQFKEGEVSPIGLACLYGALAKRQKEFDWLQKAYEYRDPHIVFLNVNMEADPLRSDPRFQDPLRRMNFPH